MPLLHDMDRVLHRLDQIEPSTSSPIRSLATLDSSEMREPVQSPSSVLDVTVALGAVGRDLEVDYPAPVSVVSDTEEVCNLIKHSLV